LNNGGNTVQNQIMKSLKSWGLVALVVASLTTGGVTVASSEVSLHEIKQISELQDNESLDRRKVKFDGWVRSIEFPLGRLKEARFTKMVVGEGEDEITVFFSTPIVGNMLGARVSVRGKYFASGWFGGFPQYEDFIVGNWVGQDYGYRGEVN